MTCTPKRYRFFTGLILGLFLFSCSTTHPLKTEKKQAEHLPDLPVSEIDIPIRVAAAPLLVKTESGIPTTFTSDGWPNFMQPTCDFRYKYRFVRTKIQLSCTNNQIGVSFGGSYQVAGGKTLCTAGIPVAPWVSGSCGFVPEPMRKVTIALQSNLQFTPGYQLKTKTAVSQLQTSDRCQVSLFSSDITQLVLDSIRSSLMAYGSSIDQQLAATSFSNYLQQAASMVYKALPVGQYGYLLVDPTAMRIGPLNYANDSFSISVGMSLHPLAGSDAAMVVPGTKSLPPLEQHPARHGIRLYLDAVYDYAFLSKLLHDSLYNKVFDVKNRTIVVKDCAVRGIGNHEIEVKVDFAGSNHGSLFLRGRPELDSAKQTLTLQHISYSMEGEDLALKLARSLFKNKIRKTLQGNAYLDLAALLRGNMPRIDNLINKQIARGIRSSGKATDIRMIGLLVTDDHLEAQAVFVGELSLLSDGIF